jgi:alpha-galactosidase
MIYRAFCVKCAVLFFASLTFKAVALTNNLALTPQMGWNDWNAYGCGISEFIVTNNAGVIAANGMKAAGYQYVNIDDGWAGSRDSNGVIQAYSISSKFPDGIPWLANYVHNMGLKFGLYTDHGTNTCSSCIETSINPVGKDPGSYGYEYIDAFTYAQWGVDYLKNDSCNLPGGDNAMADYFRMADGLMKSGRPIFVSLCENAPHYEYWSPAEGNSWRAVGDISSSFSSMISKIDLNSRSAYLAGPGRWNDPDMLEIGNGEFVTNLIGAQTHFSMWCEMAAPLLAGDNVTSLSAQSLAILTNSEAVAVDQDPAGDEGEFVGGSRDNAEVWSRPLGYDFTTRAVALLNRSSTTPATIMCNWTNLAFQAGTTATVRDLWGHTNLGTFTNSFTAVVPPYATMLLKIVGTPIPPPVLGTNYLSLIQPIYSYVNSNSVWVTEAQNKTIAGKTLTLGGTTYTNGLGVCAISGTEYNLGGVCSSFQATIGVDDEVGSKGSVIFQVFADGRKIYDSGIMTGSSPSQILNMDMTGVRRLTLGVTDTGNDTSPGSGSRDTDDDADWANAVVIVTNTTPQVPEIPVGLTASPGNPVVLNWNNTLAALTYNVKRAPQSGGSYTTIINTPLTTFSDTNIVSGNNYYYVVSAVSSIGESLNSTEASVTACSVPLPPTNMVTTPSTGSVVVSWYASAGATSYSLYRFSPSGAPVLVASGIATTNFTDTSVGGQGALTNYYYVTAANSCNQSGWYGYTPAVTPPAAPTGLGATPGDYTVDLSWNAVIGAGGYNVLRSTTNGGPYTVIASNVSGTSYLDTTVLNNTNYFYVITAVNIGGQSADSAQVSATPIIPATAYWTNNITSSAQSWNLNVNWTNVASFPNSVNEVAVINAGLTAPQAINLNQPITIGMMQIGDANGVASYTLAANGGSLTFNNSGTTLLTQLPTSQGDVLATPVSLANNLVIVNDATNPLTLAGALTSSGGSALTIGSGILQVGNAASIGDLGSVSVTNSGGLIFDCTGTITESGVISGSGSLTNNGSGTVTLSVAETYTGATVVNGGTLALDAGNSGNSGVYQSSRIVINNGGTLQVGTDNSLTGSTAGNVVPVTINIGGTLTGLSTADGGAGTSTHIRGLLTLNGGTLAMAGTQNQPAYGSWDLDGGVATAGGANTSTISALEADPSESGGTVFNVPHGATSSGIDLLVSGGLTHGTSEGDTGIIKTGNGNMTLQSVNSYTGNTFVNGGTLALTGLASINSSPLVAVNSATLNLSGLTAPAGNNTQFSLTNATLVLGIPSTTTINETTTTLNLGGATNVVNIASLSQITSPQVIHLISYTTLNGTFNVGLGSLPSGYTGYVTNENNYVDLVLTTSNAISQLVWTGTDPGNPGNWDLGLSYNWTSNGVSTTYGQSDLVRLDDTATGQTNINLMATLMPASVMVSNNALVYNLGNGGQGGGRISGTTGLTKQGTNLLIFDETNSSGNYNDFNGGLTISAGTVQVGNGDHNGSLGLGSITDNGTLIFDRADHITNASVISGSGSLAQNGIGILTLSGANTYSGTTLIQNGTLQLNNNSALGPAGAGAVTITNGGTFDLGGPGLGDKTVVLGLKQFYVSGWGVSSNGAIINGSTTDWQYANGAILLITMQGDTAIGGAGTGIPGDGNTGGRWDLRGTSSQPGVLSTGGQPYNLFKVGGNQIVLVDTTVDTNLANIDVRQGYLEVQGTTTLGNPTNHLIVEPDAIFGMFQATNLNKNFILNGTGQGYTVFSEGSPDSIAGPITLNNGVCIFGASSGNNLTLSNAVSGSGSLMVSNATAATTLFLNGTNNTYTGNTMVMSGTLALMGNTFISSSPLVLVNSGATLDATPRADTTLTLASGQTLTGSGTVKGNVTVSSGATFEPGTGIGTLAISAKLNLITASTTVISVNKSLSPSNSLAQVAGNVVYGGTLVMTNLATNSFAAGDSFKIFNAAAYSGAFTNVVPAIPGINLAWNTNTLSSGVLSVVASPTPSPQIVTTAMNGNDFVFSGTNGVAGWPYWVLTTTNITLPITNWSLVYTGAFDASGNFIYTNPAGSNAQLFYLLELP